MRRKPNVVCRKTNVVCRKAYVVCLKTYIVYFCVILYINSLIISLEGMKTYQFYLVLHKN